MFSYSFNKVIRDLDILEVFIYKNGFTDINHLKNDGSGNTIVVYNTELSESQITNLSDIILNQYTNPYNESSDDSSLVSLYNSTEEQILLSNNQFNGVFENVSKYSTICVLITTSISKKDGAEFHYSSDGVSSDYIKKYTLDESPLIKELNVFSKYFKVILKNGTVDSTIKIQTIYHKTKNIDPYSNNIPLIKISEDVNTNGRFRSQGFSVNALANSSTIHNFTFNYPIAPLVIKFFTNETQRGDIINLIIAPDTIIGALTANVESGSSEFYVTPSSLDYLERGFVCDVNIGGIWTSLGDITSINTETNKIQVSVPFSSNATAGSYIRFSVSIIRDYILSEPGFNCIADSKIGASYVPTGIVVRLKYTNNGNTDKLFVWNTEYLY